MDAVSHVGGSDLLGGTGGVILHAFEAAGTAVVSSQSAQPAASCEPHSGRGAIHGILEKPSVVTRF